jgi:hypothetical protein
VEIPEQPTFTVNEETCLKNCFVKHKEAANFLALKLHSNLQKLIMQDPNVARVLGV